MKVIIAGSRDLTDYAHVADAMALAWMFLELRPTKIVSGGARGVDRLGEHWAKARGLPVSVFEPEWQDADGQTRRDAGMVRNRHMGRFADALVAVWDGQSKGTRQMIEFMKALGKPVYVHQVEPSANVERYGYEPDGPPF